MLNKVKIKVVGKNINRFILKLNNKKINIYNIYKKNKDCCYLIIDYDKFDDVIKSKTYYDISIIDYLGPLKIKKQLFINKYYLFFIILSFLLVFFLSRITFSIKVITNDQKMNSLILDELKQNGIKKYAYLKSYQEIQKIKKNILKKYPYLFEWLEITKKGTGYYIRFERRIKDNKQVDSHIYDIVSSRDALIMSLDIESGQIVKNINEYVKKGEVIVSADIKLNDEVKGLISASGNVYGEVWYKVYIEMPASYIEKKKTGHKLNTYGVNFFSFKILFEKSNFNDKIVLSKPIISNKIFPISFTKDIVEEVIIINNPDKKDLAIKYGLDKIKNNLATDEEILDYYILEENNNNNNYELTLFVSVKENIGQLVARR